MEEAVKDKRGKWSRITGERGEAPLGNRLKRLRERTTLQDSKQMHADTRSGHVISILAL